ncbi:MAG: NirD/YgiW/YdeI family stress tolerance protein [Blastochloris viridis]|uniref:NirD/YgiW/YdeI family stress tolerance protein n=1 Tax=Blastochloris viridis TaxID=1079 RepID=A0A6N4RBH3_BLAVI|nr:MAG: NirD/YgiW/YdeI family stress tolerance protein [Blastochloris viridis]
MKTRFFVTAAMVLAATGAYAQYTGPSAEKVAGSVKEILAKPVDDQKVVLQGSLVKHVKNDRYIFADSTGQIQVEIDTEDFPAGMKVSDKSRVEIVGEVEKHLMGDPEIDVDTVRML